MLQDVFSAHYKNWAASNFWRCASECEEEEEEKARPHVLTLWVTCLEGAPSGSGRVICRILSHSAPFESVNKHKSRHVYLIAPLAENGTVAANSRRQAANFSIIDFERTVGYPPPHPHMATKRLFLRSQRTFVGLNVPQTQSDICLPPYMPAALCSEEYRGESALKAKMMSPL